VHILQKSFFWEDLGNELALKVDEANAMSSSDTCNVSVPIRIIMRETYPFLVIMIILSVNYHHHQQTP